MKDVSCETCPFGERLDTGATANIACHLGRFSDEPWHQSTWWCSEHPLAPGQRDRIAEKIVLADIAGIMAARMQYDFRTLLKEAYQKADLALAERATRKDEEEL